MKIDRVKPECGHDHRIWFAPRGKRASEHRTWVVVGEGFAPQIASEPWGDPLPLAPGTRLRYDQRDADPFMRMEAWDRFCVLDGPEAGTCVFLLNRDLGGSVEDDEPRGMIEPVPVS